jgi:hypothetical protein
VIYVNGDSHSAGADIIPGICFAQDDLRYLVYGRRAHPEAVVQTYGYYIAQMFNQGFFCEAESGSSNDRIMRTTKQYINSTKDKKSIGWIIIGWTGWEREEWKHGEDYIQITASGTDSVPESMEEEYKEWIVNQTYETLESKRVYWQEQIKNFSEELTQQNINHIFFNTLEYTEHLLKNGYKCVGDSNHFDAAGHKAWGMHLSKTIKNYYLNNDTQGLTQPAKRSIITQVKQEFKGLKR